MHRRVVLPFAVAASLAISSGPVMGADAVVDGPAWAYGIGGTFSTVSFDSDGNILPGRYVQAVAYSGLYADGQQAYAEVAYVDVSYDALGNATVFEYISGRGLAESMEVQPKLAGGELVASLPVTGCTQHDPATGACVAFGAVGAIDVDLTAVASDRKWHAGDTVPSVARGLWQSVWHSSQFNQPVDLTGSFTFNGVSLGDVTTWDGNLQAFKSMTVSVTH